MTKEEFFEKVYPEPTSGCWLWSGRHDKNGYGRISNIPHQLTHRQSYAYVKGEFDLNKHLLHTCDNPACVNPDHLYLGDQRQNNNDRDSRGRQKTKRGCEHKLSRFTHEQISEIRSLYSQKTHTSRKLAIIYSCSQKAIMNIINHKSYK
jgi:hypothetical protein